MSHLVASNTVRLGTQTAAPTALRLGGYHPRYPVIEPNGVTDGDRVMAITMTVAVCLLIMVLLWLSL